jgi:translation initiation factor 2 gamma subunit (eIF-2gamma)
MVNVGTIGNIDHGKTTLTDALVKVLGAEMARKVVIVDGDPRTDTKLSDLDDYDEAIRWPHSDGKTKSAKRAKKERMKAVRLKAFLGK